MRWVGPADRQCLQSANSWREDQWYSEREGGWGVVVVAKKLGAPRKILAQEFHSNNFSFFHLPALLLLRYFRPLQHDHFVLISLSFIFLPITSFNAEGQQLCACLAVPALARRKVLVQQFNSKSSSRPARRIQVFSRSSTHTIHCQEGERSVCGS